MPFSVLVVDDDPTFLALTTRSLACLGLEVAGTAADAAQALELARRTRPSAVLVDIWGRPTDGNFVTRAST